MLSQVVYETNADWTASQEAMAKNPLVVADVTEKGLLWFRFIDNHTVFLLSPMGKLQVKWSDVSEKRTLFRLVKNLLVARSNEELLIRPVKQQTWIEYPVPDSFKLYWCDQESEFVLRKISEATGELGGSAGKIVSNSGEKSPSSSVSKFQIDLANVKKALEELRHELRFFREPTINEVALKSGCLNLDTLRIGFICEGLKAQSPESAKWRAEAAINLAAWLRFKASGELNLQLIALSKKAIDAASMDVLERAQIILKNFPDLVPEANATELRWPEQTKIEWIRIFGGEPPASQSRKYEVKSVP